MIAFEYATDSDVLAFESDVIIRWKLFVFWFYEQLAVLHYS